MRALQGIFLPGLVLAAPGGDLSMSSLLSVSSLLSMSALLLISLLLSISKDHVGWEAIDAGAVMIASRKRANISRDGRARHSCEECIMCPVRIFCPFPVLATSHFRYAMHACCVAIPIPSFRPFHVCSHFHHAKALLGLFFEEVVVRSRSSLPDISSMYLAVFVAIRITSVCARFFAELL